MTLARTTPAPPVRIVHLGLGNFFRAHQAWYTANTPDAAEWGIAAFTGRSHALADVLTDQEGLYTLVTRGPEQDRSEVVQSVVRAHAAGDHRAWLGYFATPSVRVVTCTVTEAGYMQGVDGGLDHGHTAVQRDIEELRVNPTAMAQTAPGRLVAGLARRRAADAGPVTAVPCDNLPANGEVLRRVVRDLSMRVDPGLSSWIDAHVGFVTTTVDRITPAPSPAQLARMVQASSDTDRAPVLTEPFSEWVLSGRFPGGRPRWENAGAVLTDDIEPFERRKLWLLNGGHSLLAYAGSARGHMTVAQAMADPLLRGWVEDWWRVASAHLHQPEPVIEGYLDALRRRFANPRMRHRLDQIAADGSQKLPARVIPVLLRDRAAGRDLYPAGRVLAAWICHLRGAGPPVTDVRAAELTRITGRPLPDAVARVLDALDPELAATTEVRSAVIAAAEHLQRHGPSQ